MTKKELYNIALDSYPNDKRTKNYLDFEEALVLYVKEILETLINGKIK